MTSKQKAFLGLFGTLGTVWGGAYVMQFVSRWAEFPTLTTLFVSVVFFLYVLFYGLGDLMNRK